MVGVGVFFNGFVVGFEFVCGLFWCVVWFVCKYVDLCIVFVVYDG